MCNELVPASGPGGQRRFSMAKMKKVTRGAKSLLNQRVRVGLFSVPLWVAGAVYLARRLRDRRRHQHVTA
jgi:hypothetical protein